MTYLATATINGIRAVGIAASRDYFQQYCCQEVNPRDLSRDGRSIVGETSVESGRRGADAGVSSPGGGREGRHPRFFRPDEGRRFRRGIRFRFMRKNRDAAACFDRHSGIPRCILGRQIDG